MDLDEARTLLTGGEEGRRLWNRFRESCRKGFNLSGIVLDGVELGSSPSNDPAKDILVTNLAGCNLSGSSLRSADLRAVNLAGSILTSANLRQANLEFADLSGAEIRYADLQDANLLEAILEQSDLYGSDLTYAGLRSTRLDGSKFHNVVCGDTIFSCVDMASVEGLETVRHRSPSTLGTDTLVLSRGQISECFLRGCGLPDAWIVNLPSLIGAMQPIQFYSVFISYSARDTPLVERLHADLQAKGVRCWYAPEDLKIGDRIRVGIDEAIRLHDKLLLVLSKHSVASDWVEKEVETAMEQERRQKRTVLFPIRLDDVVMKAESGWAADIRRSRNIGDFTKWKDHDAYQKAFDRLLRDLKAKDTAAAKV